MYLGFVLLMLVMVGGIYDRVMAGVAIYYNLGEKYTEVKG